MSTLNTILSDEDTSDEDVVTEEVTEQPEAEAQPVEEPQEEAQPEAAEPPAEEPRLVPLEALQEERQKRQELADRLDRLEQTQKPRAPEPIPDMLEEPEKYQAWLQGNLRTVQLDAFEESAREVHGDEVVENAYRAFKQVEQTPEGAAILASRNPWRSMVKWHKDREEAAKFSDPEWRAAEREKIRAEILAEEKAKASAIPPPPSLAKATNLGERTSREIDESALSLDDILGTPSA